MMYVVLVTQTVVTCQSIVVSGPDEAAAIEAGITEFKDHGRPMTEVSNTWAGEVTRAVVPAAAPAQDQHAKKTVAMKVMPRLGPPNCTCVWRDGERIDTRKLCTIHGHEVDEF